MATIQPKGLELLYQLIGRDLKELKTSCRRAIDGNESLVFDPNAGDSAMVATMKDVVERLAAKTDRHVVWKERQASGMLSTTACKLTLLERKSRQSTIQATRAALATLSIPRRSSMMPTLRRQFSSHTLKRQGATRDLDPVLNEAGAVFVCCSRKDAIGHARVLRSALSERLNRGCAIGGGLTTAGWIDQADAIVVLLTKCLPTDPDALFEIWKALKSDVPVITVSITGMCKVALSNSSFRRANVLRADRMSAPTPMGRRFRDGFRRLFKSVVGSAVKCRWRDPAEEKRVDRRYSRTAEDTAARWHRRRGNGEDDP